MTKRVNISSLPSNIPMIAIHLALSGIVKNPFATSPKPGPRLLSVSCYSGKGCDLIETCHHH